MKVNFRLIFRLAIHVTLSLVLLAVLINIELFVLIEWLLPQEGDRQDAFVLNGMLLLIVFFVLFLGWTIGKPLFYIIGWINRLASGIYVEPDHHRKIYSRNKKKLKRPYHLYKELIVQLHTLADVLETSKQARSHSDNMQKEWIAGISHDLKTPLTYIKGYSSMLLTPHYEWNTEEKTKFLMEIEHKADHMQELIGDLNLSFRMDDQQLPLNLEPTDLVEYVKRIMVDVANDPRAVGYNLSFEADEPYLEKLLDIKLLGRALNNLLLNAILHNPAGTKVHIQITRTTHLNIRITDDGIGMDEESLEGLFNKYYRGTTTDSRSEGTGLGMAIAKQLVLAHGGDIRVTSTVNVGTSITLMLPL
ncbi:HAMP domain-containing histidine kinase [Paenibacillus anaericanus]|uniref:histidine kinase n=1 Tax=Paenibacillus anaericanus TaxID=170367 RepID=A0A433Y1C0_9BACL|nr:HAMP domain-containing sensor histidine kinase [Paenibacillus anaericanus]RUT41443.1 HAMP domain-containing histidine kinase [Paenibacillus anaericanus]